MDNVSRVLFAIMDGIMYLVGAGIILFLIGFVLFNFWRMLAFVREWLPFWAPGAYALLGRKLYVRRRVATGGRFSQDGRRYVASFLGEDGLILSLPVDWEDYLHSHQKVDVLYEDGNPVRVLVEYYGNTYIASCYLCSVPVVS